MVLSGYNNTVHLLAGSLPKGHNLGGISYTTFTDHAYVHFAVKGQDLDLDQIGRTSEKVADAELAGRPIVIYGFNPETAVLLLKQKYELTKIKIV